MTNNDCKLIAEERDLYLNLDTLTYYDSCGNEYRDENGECMVGGLPDNISVCSACDEHSNDDTDTVFDKHGDPYHEWCLPKGQE